MRDAAAMQIASEQRAEVAEAALQRDRSASSREDEEAAAAREAVQQRAVRAAADAAREAERAAAADRLSEALDHERQASRRARCAPLLLDESVCGCSAPDHRRPLS